MTPHIDRVQRRPLTRRELEDQRTRAARAERHEAEQARASLVGAGLTDAEHREVEQRADIDELVAAADQVVRQHAEANPRLAERIRQQDLAHQFADAIDLGPRTGAQLAHDLFSTDIDTPED